MRKTTPQEALAVVAAFVLVGTVYVVSNLPRWLDGLERLAARPDRLLVSVAPTLAPIVVGVLTIAAARILATNRTLRSRVRFELIPSDAFDPSPDAVVRFAAQLTRTRRAVGGCIDHRASAVRVLLRPDGDGVVHYLIEVPRRARATVRAALAVYDGVEVREVDAAMPGAGAGVRSARCELVLARPSHEPLRDAGLDPDPLQAFASVLGELRAGDGERGVVAIDLAPVTPRRRRWLRRRLLRRVAHETGVERGGLGELLGEPRAHGGGLAPGELVARRLEVRGLEAKLGSAEPLFALQVLMRVDARGAGRARAQLQALLACFDAFAGENHLRVAGLPLVGLRFLGSDLPGRRHWFDRRLRTGLFRPARRGMVTPSELAGLLKPPTARCRAANVTRSGAVVSPPPRGLPTFAGESRLIPLGRVRERDGERRVGVAVAETYFAYMAGRSRYGKTETAIGQFVHLVRQGHGGLFLDPHADAIAEIKAYLTEPEVRERVVEINLADHRAEAAQPAWNPLAIEGRPAHEAGRRAEAVVDALAAALGWDERNTRALNLTTQAAQALVELAHVLPADRAPTLFQLPTLLSDDDWRAAALPYLSPPTRQFFAERFPRLPAEAVTTVTNLIDRLRVARPVAALLGAPGSSYDARRALERGLVVLACPGSGSTRDRVVANLLVYDVLHAAKGRAAVAPERRRPFWVFLDELQTYDGPNLPALLEQSAKYGGRAFLFNQNPERLSEATWNAVTTNRSHLLTTTVNAHAAALIAREWGGAPSAEALTQLARYTFLASVTLGGRPTRPFLVEGLRARELHADAYHPELVSELDAAIDRRIDPRPVDETIAALERHDERIREWLEQGGTGGDAGSEAHTLGGE